MLVSIYHTLYLYFSVFVSQRTLLALSLHTTDQSQCAYYVRVDCNDRWNPAANLFSCAVRCGIAWWKWFLCFFFLVFLLSKDATAMMLRTQHSGTLTGITTLVLFKVPTTLQTTPITRTVDGWSKWHLATGSTWQYNTPTSPMQRMEGAWATVCK